MDGPSWEWGRAVLVGKVGMQGGYAGTEGVTLPVSTLFSGWRKEKLEGSSPREKKVPDVKSGTQCQFLIFDKCAMHHGNINY